MMAARPASKSTPQPSARSTSTGSRGPHSESEQPWRMIGSVQKLPGISERLMGFHRRLADLQRRFLRIVALGLDPGPGSEPLPLHGRRTPEMGPSTKSEGDGMEVSRAPAVR